VLDTVGREVWRWSEGRMFTQSIRNRVLGSRETMTYREEWDGDRMHGRYTAVATLRSAAHPLEQRIDFTLP
jgi:hypothetical protein